MASQQIPQIFSRKHRLAARKRLRHLRARPDAARYVLEDMVDEVEDRLSFTRHGPSRSLVVGDWSGRLRTLIGGDVIGMDIDTLDLEQPFPQGDFDFIAVLGLLDTVNDLPGALVHIRNALSEGGMAIASFIGAGSLPMLRQIMLAADGDRPAARIHPMVDVRAGAQLLQRAGWADPVVDSHAIRVSYDSLQRLIEDLRAQGLGNVLASRAPGMGKAGLARAEAKFAELAGEDGRVTETFEIVTLTGRRPKARF